MTTPSPVVRITRRSWRNGSMVTGERAIPEETAVVFTYNRTSYAVMMATPADLEDFAVGFSLAERIVTAPDQIESLEIIAGDDGVELRMSITDPRTDAFYDRRRYLAGPTGCGLCGIESLSEAMRPPPVVLSDLRLSAEDITSAQSLMQSSQAINRETRAVHAAGYWEPGGGLIAVREDVGRHNALDKLAGALARSATNPAHGVVVLTSRVSVELVQKAAIMGVPVIAAVSAPTALAVRMAAAAGITLIAIVRDDGFEVFTHAGRIAMRAIDRVA